MTEEEIKQQADERKQALREAMGAVSLSLAELAFSPGGHKTPLQNALQRLAEAHFWADLAVDVWVTGQQEQPKAEPGT